MRIRGIFVVYSGGMDSFTVLHKALLETQKENVQAISFNYGQRHRKELDFAQRVTYKLSIQHRIINLAAVRDLIKGSALTSSNVEVPEGHYEAESMKATVVPGRNTFMLALAMAYAESQLAHYNNDIEIWYGAHSGDHHIYPDCRPAYVEAMQDVMRIATEGRVKLIAPYLYGDKVSILSNGFEWGLNYADTWTCYKGLEKPCGACGACQERALAFKTIGKRDPALA